MTWKICSYYLRYLLYFIIVLLIEKAVEALEASPSSIPLQSYILEKRNRLRTLIEKEEADPKEISKLQWLRLGDSNTRFFSIATRMSRSKNSTQKILNRNENQTMPRIQMESKSTDYFRNLFKTPSYPLPNTLVVYLSSKKLSSFK